jgi:hypothetical protein
VSQVSHAPAVASRRRLAVVVAMALMPTAACGSIPGLSPGSEAKAPAAKPSAPPSPKENGIAARQGKQIFQAAAKALESAPSVHMKGAQLSKGDKIGIDMRSDRSSFTGTMQGPFNGRTISLTIMQTGGKVYVRGKEFIRAAAGAAAANKTGDRWLELGSAQEARANDMDFTVNRFAKELLKPRGRIIKAKKPTTIAGQPAIAIQDSQSRLYIATTGQPYPLRIMNLRNRRAVVNFTEYGAPLQITAPANPLTRSDVQGGG